MAANTCSWGRFIRAEGNSAGRKSFLVKLQADVELGEHTITARAIDKEGNLQPAKDDPLIANKITYWESNGPITRRVEIP